MEIQQQTGKSLDTLSQLCATGVLEASELSIVVVWLMNQLSAWEFAKISQGGYTNADVPLRRVFIDLPVTDISLESRDLDERVLFLHRFLKARPINMRRAIMRKRHKPSRTLRIMEAPAHEPTNEYKQSFSSILLIGGPGQGKSTLGQIACQIQRASLLHPFLTQFKTSEQDLVRSFESTPENVDSSISIGGRRNRTFPLQVSLPELSSWLTSNPKQTELPQILHFIAGLTSSKQCKIDVEILAKLISKLPALIVFDGFDEVGAVIDRARLVSAANDLLHFVAQKNGAAQIIATTRPQGYMGEFDKLAIELEPSNLAALNKSEALNYAEKLLFAKIPNSDERSETLNKLRSAASEPATERLLTTPLQVTILAALVHQRGRAPRERWNLFHGYFTYSYSRETERNSYAAELLRNFRTHIEQIHARVALLLQVEAERVGGGSGRMPKERLKEIIEAVLAEAGYDEAEKQSLVVDIAKAAEERLVFLVEPEPGSFGFEIRSFQEFMCAWALTSGPERYIVERLKLIARAPMFRNVLLFAFSRFFSEGSHLRDPAVTEIMPGLNQLKNDLPASLTLSGSLLALETIEEGAALSYPKWARQLMEVACSILTLPPSEEHRRLARTVTPEIEKVLLDRIESVNIPDTNIDYLSVWVVLAELCAKNDHMATQVADSMWAKATDREEILNTLSSVGFSIIPWLKNKILASPANINPSSFLRLRNVRGDVSSIKDWVSFLCDAFDRETTRRLKPRHFDLNRLVPTNEVLGVPHALPPPPDAWKPWCDTAIFQRSPSALTLYQALLSIAENPELGESISWRVSWPLAIMIRRTTSGDDYLELAKRTKAGQFGDIAEWRRIEQTLRHSEFRIDGLLTTAFFQGFDLTGLQAIISWWGTDATDAIQATQELQKINSLFFETKTAHTKDWAARSAISLYATGSRKWPLKELGLLNWIKHDPDAAADLVPRPEHMPYGLWEQVLNDAYLSSKFPYHHSL
jgi:hypothetical protein